MTRTNSVALLLSDDLSAELPAYKTYSSFPKSCRRGKECTVSASAWRARAKCVPG